MGLRLFFLTNFPGAMFFQGATFIPDSRVVLFNWVLYINIQSEGSIFQKSVNIANTCNFKFIEVEMLPYNLIYHIVMEPQEYWENSETADICKFCSVFFFSNWLRGQTQFLSILGTEKINYCKVLKKSIVMYYLDCQNIIYSLWN